MTEQFETLLAQAAVESRLLMPLARYGALVLETNRAFNLTGAKSPAELVPHIVDSLTITSFVRDALLDAGPGAALIDVGSGAGGPAIPVALATGVSITLIESNRKKAGFLRRMMAEFELAGEVVAERAEVAGRQPHLRDAFTCGTARAVSSAPVVAELLLPFIAPGGVAIFQRGALDPPERAALADAALVLAAQIIEERVLEGERRIVLARKIGATPERFPRRTGVPEKRPLCA
jgi:16S rRNA (guanine527-N7)-methyltransferase